MSTEASVTVLDGEHVAPDRIITSAAVPWSRARWDRFLQNQVRMP
jgi:hypothetical protein